MLQPKNDYVVVKRDKPEDRAGGIELVLARDAVEEPATGEVLAVGPGKRNRRGELVPLSVKAGDRVLLGHYCGDTVKIEGEGLVLIKESELLGVL